MELTQTIKITKKMFLHLINRILDFSETSQILILEIFSLYIPQDDNEMLEIMNTLDIKLKHSCISIVMATVKIFMNFTIKY